MHLHLKSDMKFDINTDGRTDITDEEQLARPMNLTAVDARRERTGRGATDSGPSSVAGGKPRRRTRTTDAPKPPIRALIAAATEEPTP